MDSPRRNLFPGALRYGQLGGAPPESRRQQHHRLLCEHRSRDPLDVRRPHEISVDLQSSMVFATVPEHSTVPG